MANLDNSINVELDVNPANASTQADLIVRTNVFLSDAAIDSETGKPSRLFSLATDLASTLVDICHSPSLSRYVGVGTNLVRYTSNGVAWSNGSIATGTWTSVAWSPTLAIFVAVGTNVAASSTDGITFTSRTITAVAWKSVVWSSRLSAFVAMGTDSVAFSSDGITWAATAPSSFISVAYSSSLGLLAVISSSGGIMTSPTGVTWTTRTSPVSSSLSDIVWSASAGKFVAISNSVAESVVSTDGITWTRYVLPVSGLKRITYGNSLFVAVGTSGQIITSSNGTTWVQRTSGVSWTINSVIWVAGTINKFIAVGGTSSTTANVLTSADGITWTARSTPGKPTAAAYSCAVYAPELGIYVILTNGGSYVTTSTDGKYFTSGSISGNPNFTSISYSSTAGFVAVCSTGSIYTSSNGTTWSQLSLPSTTTPYSLGIAWSPTLSLFVSVGLTMTYSTDGRNWQNGTGANLGTARNVTWSNGMFLCVTNESGGTYYWKSTNGTSWTRGTLPVNANWTRMINVAGWSEPYIVCGHNVVYSSADGVTWNIRDARQTDWYGLAYSPSLDRLVVVGSDTDNGASKSILTTDDGISYTARTRTENNGWIDVVWSSSLSLFVAISMNGTNRIMTSPTGVTWTARSAPSVATWTAIGWSSDLGMFYAVSDLSNVAMYSTNGTTWTLENSSAALAWTGVAWSSSLGFFIKASTWTSRGMSMSTNGTTWKHLDYNSYWTSVAWSSSLGLFAAVAIPADSHDNACVTSPNGTTWTSREIPEYNSWTSICWAGGSIAKFIAVAKTGTNRVMVSSDGITWTAHAAAEANLWSGVCWSSGLAIVVAVSLDGTNRVMSSTNGTTWTARSASAANSWKSVEANNSVFVAISQSGGIMYSTNGTSWSSATIPATQTGYLWGAVAWSASLGLFVVASSNGSNYPMMYSSDGITWAHKMAINGEWKDVDYSSSLGLFVGIGYGANFSFATSSDAITWSPVEGEAAGQYLVSIAWSPTNAKFVTMVYQSTTPKVSTDGTTWSSTGNSLSVCNGRLLWDPDLAKFFFGGVGVIVYDADGAGTWTSASPPLPTGSWNRIGDSGTLFVALSTGFGYSVDGTTWVTGSMPASITWTGLSHSSELGLWIAAGYSGSNGYIASSPDGITWTLRLSSTSAAFNDVLWMESASCFVAAGVEIWYSADGLSWIPLEYSLVVTNTWKRLTWNSNNSTLLGVGSATVANVLFSDEFNALSDIYKYSYIKLYRDSSTTLTVSLHDGGTASQPPSAANGWVGVTLYKVKIPLVGLNYKVKIHYTERFVVVYVNDVLVIYYQIRNIEWPTEKKVFLFSITNSGTTDYRIVELSEDKDAVFFDMQATSLSAMGDVIQERPVKMRPALLGGYPSARLYYNYRDQPRQRLEYVDQVVEEDSVPNATSDTVVYGEDVFIITDEKIASEFGYSAGVMKIPSINSGGQKAVAAAHASASRRATKTGSIGSRLDPRIESGDLLEVSGSFHHGIWVGFAVEAISTKITLQPRNMRLQVGGPKTIEMSEPVYFVDHLGNQLVDESSNEFVSISEEIL